MCSNKQLYTNDPQGSEELMLKRWRFHSHCEVLRYLPNPATLTLDRRMCEKQYEGQSIKSKFLRCISATG